MSELSVINTCGLESASEKRYKHGCKASAILISETHGKNDLDSSSEEDDCTSGLLSKICRLHSEVKVTEEASVHLHRKEKGSFVATAWSPNMAGLR